MLVEEISVVSKRVHFNDNRMSGIVNMLKRTVGFEDLRGEVDLDLIVFTYALCACAHGFVSFQEDPIAIDIASLDPG